MGEMVVQGEGNSLARLRREAEIQMSRVLDESRPRKRPRGSSGDATTSMVPIDRFRYSVVQELEAGAKGFIVTCSFRREKSATREACHHLRSYMPADLFPASPLGPPPPDLGGPPTCPPDVPLDGAKLQQQLECASTELSAESPYKEGGALPGQRCSTVPGAAGGEAAADCSQPGLGGTVGGEGSGGRDDEEDDEDDDDEGEGGVPQLGDSGVGAGAVSASEGVRAPAALGLAKVGCRGVVLIRLSTAAAVRVDPVEVLRAVLGDLERGALQPPRHCQRLIPLDATCLLTASGLAAAVAQAAGAFKRRQEGGSGAAETPPFTYAIVWRSRASETHIPSGGGRGGGGDAGGGGGGAGGADAAKPVGKQELQQRQQGRQGQGEEEMLTDRGRIISLVAAAMAEAFGPAAKVNLKHPQVAVLVEAVPMAGRHFAGVVLLPASMFVARGKLAVKPLINNVPSY